MSGKTDKRIRRVNNKIRKRIEEQVKEQLAFSANDFVIALREQPFALRWRMAVYLLTGWLKPKEVGDDPGR